MRLEGIQETIFRSLHRIVFPVIENIRQIDFWSLFQFNDRLALFYLGKSNVRHKMPFCHTHRCGRGCLTGQHYVVQLNKQNLLIWNNHIFHLRPITLRLHGRHLYFPEGSGVNTAECQTPGPAEIKCLRSWTQKCDFQKELTSPVGGRF